MDDKTKDRLAAAIKVDADTLFGHLPDYEILEDERIDFTLAEGRLSVWVKRTGYIYTLLGDRVWRYMSIPFGRVEVDVFEHGRVIETIMMQMDGNGNLVHF